MKYTEIFKELHVQKTCYLAGGSFALKMYRNDIMVTEIDIIISSVPENVKAFLRAMKNLGYEPQGSFEFTDTANTGLFINDNSAFLPIRAIGKPKHEFDAMWDLREVVAEDLIPISLQDQKDIEQLKKLTNEN